MNFTIKTSKRSHRTMMIAGDFNAKSTAWGGIKTDRRGTYLLDMLSKNGIVPIRINKRYTFYKNERISFLDIISTDKGLAKKHKGNKILNTLSTSDYTYVLHDLETIKTIILNTQRRKWIQIILF